MGMVVYAVSQEGKNERGEFEHKTLETFERKKDAEDYAYFRGLCDTIDECPSEIGIKGGYVVESLEAESMPLPMYIGAECNRDEKGYWHYSIYPTRSPRRPHWYFGEAVNMAIPFHPNMTLKQAKRRIRRKLVNFLAREAKKGKVKKP